jgi:predicted PurR-regulated permease PerM
MPDSPGEPGARIQNAFFIGLLVVVSIAFAWLLTDYLLPIFWAAIFAVLFHPVQRRVARRLGGRQSLAALLTVLVIFVTVILPALLIGSAVVREGVGVYQRVSSGELDPGAVIRWVEGVLPQVSEWARQAGIDTGELRNQLSSSALNASQFIAGLLLSTGQNALRFSVMFFLMLYLLFFFLRDGTAMLQHVVHALPLGDERERQLMNKFAEVSRATIKGTLVIGAVQGTLGGIMFALLGIDAAVFWGVVMTLLSILPVVGAGIVWLPAALIMLAGGAWTKALILVLFGVLVIGLVDNLLRPVLVGRDTRMPDYLVLLSTLGGLSIFGVSGFVIGPVIAALFLVIWAMFEAEHRSPGGVVPPAP